MGETSEVENELYCIIKPVVEKIDCQVQSVRLSQVSMKLVSVCITCYYFIKNITDCMHNFIYNMGWIFFKKHLKQYFLSK